MNEDTIKGNWKQFKGNLKEQWGRSATGKPATQPSVSTTDLFSPSGGVSAALVHHTY